MLGRDGLVETLDALSRRPDATELLERIRALASETRDDMAACIVSPEISAVPAELHVEELHASERELESGAAAAFIEACGAPAAEAKRTVELAASIAAVSGGALICVESSDGVILSSAAAPPPPPLAAAPGQPPSAAQDAPAGEDGLGGRGAAWPDGAGARRESAGAGRARRAAGPQTPRTPARQRRASDLGSAGGVSRSGTR
jgi:hypothetical protein